MKCQQLDRMKEAIAQKKPTLAERIKIKSGQRQATQIDEQEVLTHNSSDPSYYYLSISYEKQLSQLPIGTNMFMRAAL